MSTRYCPRCVTDYPRTGHAIDWPRMADEGWVIVGAWLCCPRCWYVLASQT